MDKCSKCDGFTARRTFADPPEYRDFVRQLIAIVNQGKFSLLRADCPLQEMLKDPWARGDVVVHDLQCAGCGREFQLCVNVWNGRDWWQPEPWPERLN
jgi:hypothetical protein